MKQNVGAHINDDSQFRRKFKQNECNWKICIFIAAGSLAAPSAVSQSHRDDSPTWYGSHPSQVSLEANPPTEWASHHASAGDGSPEAGSSTQQVPILKEGTSVQHAAQTPSTGGPASVLQIGPPDESEGKPLYCVSSGFCPVEAGQHVAACASVLHACLVDAPANSSTRSAYVFHTHANPHVRCHVRHRICAKAWVGLSICR